MRPTIHLPPSAEARKDVSEGGAFSSPNAVGLLALRTAEPVVPQMRIAAGNSVADQLAADLPSVARPPLAMSVKPAISASVFAQSLALMRFPRCLSQGAVGT